jgi:hypothetical protein
VPRRIVTGHDLQGASVIASDGPALWNTTGAPAPIAASERGTDHRWETAPAPSEHGLRLVDGAFTPELRAVLPPGALHALMDDPEG